MPQSVEEESPIILAILVTHNPDMRRLTPLLQELANSKASTIVIDNNSEPKLIISDKIKLIENRINEGLAAAQNQGIEYAKSNNFEHVLFLDQDSFISKLSIEKILEDLKLISTHYKVGAISPLYRGREEKNKYAPHIKISKYGLLKKLKAKRSSKPREVDLLISSGKVVPVNVFDSVGPMNEELFIDYVDTEWCFRAKNQGFHLFSSTRCELIHDIGEGSKRFMGFNIPLHSPERRYYRARNAVILLGMPHIPFAIALREILACIFHHIFFLLLWKNKKAYLRYLKKGFLDGTKELYRLKKI